MTIIEIGEITFNFGLDDYVLFAVLIFIFSKIKMK